MAGGWHSCFDTIWSHLTDNFLELIMSFKFFFCKYARWDNQIHKWIVQLLDWIGLGDNAVKNVNLIDNILEVGISRWLPFTVRWVLIWIPNLPTKQGTLNITEWLVGVAGGWTSCLVAIWTYLTITFLQVEKSLTTKLYYCPLINLDQKMSGVLDTALSSETLNRKRCLLYHLTLLHA